MSAVFAQSYMVTSTTRPIKTAFVDYPLMFIPKPLCLHANGKHEGSLRSKLVWTVVRKLRYTVHEKNNVHK